MVAAADLGAAGPEVLASVGLDAAAPWDPKVMIPDQAYYDLLERMAAITDVTALPLRVGAAMRCDDYGALGLAWKAAPDLLGSFARVERYARLWTSVVEYELRETPEGMLFLLHRAGVRRLGMRLSNEATLAASVSLARQVAPGPVAPLRVLIRHPAPAVTAAHEAYFAAPVQFGADMDALLFSHEVLARPNRLGDAGITRFLMSHLETELARILPEPEPGLVQSTRDAIARALSEGMPKMADIARGLGLSARSFHRRLADHGVSFQTLTEDTRRELAEGLLRDESYSLAEIAFLTGFSEQSAFSRAFKRWAGQTPAQYRKARQRR